MKNFAFFAVMLLLAFSAADAAEQGASIWDVYVNVDYAYDGDETLTLFNLPDGTGKPFTEAFHPDGYTVDATLRIQLIDWEGNPVPGFPAEDMWLESVDGSLDFCLGGGHADSDTDEDGWTVWALPLGAVGSSTSQCRVLVNGMVAQGWEDLNLQFNSADITGDGVVNLADVSTFAESYFGTYSFEADFYCDGVLSLQDVGLLATGIGTQCP